MSPVKTIHTHYARRHPWHSRARRLWHRVFGSKACPCGTGLKFKDCCGRAGEHRCRYMQHEQRPQE